MSSFFKSLRRTWPFRNQTNFMISFLGFSTTSYFSFKYYLERKFNNDIITEALRLLEKNEQIIELVGYPLSLTTSLRASAVLTESICNFSFSVRGPKGTINVELGGNAKSHKEITEGSDYRIVIKPAQNSTYKDPAIEKREFLKEIIEESEKRKGLTREAKTEEEFEEIRKFRMQEMYRKMGYMRFVTVLIVLGGVMSFYIYIMKYKRKNIAGSELHQKVITFVKLHPEIRKVFGENIRFTQTIRGAWVDKKANFETDFYGESGFGTVIAEGNYDKSKDEWTLENLRVQVKSKEIKKQKEIKII